MGSLSGEPRVRVPAVVAPSSEIGVVELAQEIAAAAGLVSLPIAEPALDGPPSIPWVNGLSLAEPLPASMAFGIASLDLTEGLARTLSWFEALAGRRRTDRTSGVFTCDNRVPATAPARDKLRAG